MSRDFQGLVALLPLVPADARGHYCHASFAMALILPDDCVCVQRIAIQSESFSE